MADAGIDGGAAHVHEMRLDAFRLVAPWPRGDDPVELAAAEGRLATLLGLAEN